MRGMEFRKLRRGDALRLAVIASLLLHGAVLLIGSSSKTGPPGQPGTGPTRPRLTATLQKPAAPAPVSPPRTPSRQARRSTQASSKPAAHRLLTAPSGAWAARSWSREERSDMDKFLNEPPAPAPTGRQLADNALAMARQPGRQPRDEEETSGQPAGKAVEPLSMEMYFDAFVRKLNRSAAFVTNDTRHQGSRKALVQIALNPDGSLKSYRILRAADQQAEIAYIRKVLDQAAPFSPFPPDIRNALGALTIQMCIYPPHDGGGGGFSRSFGGQDCRD